MGTTTTTDALRVLRRLAAMRTERDRMAQSAPTIEPPARRRQPRDGDRRPLTTAGLQPYGEQGIPAFCNCGATFESVDVSRAQARALESNPKGGHSCDPNDVNVVQSTS